MLPPSSAEVPTNRQKRDFRAIRTRAAEKKAKRVAKVQASAELSAALDSGAGRALAKAVGLRLRKVKKKMPARKAAFLRLKRLCKAFVMARAQAQRDGFCEIAMSCRGANVANTWYHLWPQKGGNGLKYDVRAHAASCSECNMGEYGARMRGAETYINRHKEMLGMPLWQELNALHGRRQIGTVEAREMGNALEAMLGREL